MLEVLVSLFLSSVDLFSAIFALIYFLLTFSYVICNIAFYVRLGKPLERLLGLFYCLLCQQILNFIVEMASSSYFINN